MNSYNIVSLKNKYKMRTYIIPLFLLLTSCATYTNNVRNDSIPYCHLEIKQTVLPYSKDYSFVVTNGYLFIFELKTSTHETSNKTILLKRKLTKNEVLDIESALVKLENIESNYTNDTWIDGVHWEINYVLGEISRKIIVENMGVDEVTSLFENVNKFIPDNSPPIIIWEP